MSSDNRDLWSVSDTVRLIKLFGSEAETIVSQACVVAKLIKTDKEFANSGWHEQTYLKEMLAAVNDYLTNKTGLEGLLSLADNAWSNLSLRQVIGLIEHIESECQTVDEILDLVSRYRNFDRKKIAPAYPAEVANLIFSLLDQPDSLGLYGEPAAANIIDFIRLNPGPKLSVISRKMDGREEDLTLKRIAFIADAEDRLFENKTDVNAFPGRAQFLHSSWARKITRDQESVLEHLPSVFRDKAKRLSQEEAELLSIITRRQAKSMVALMPSGFLSQGGLTAEVRRWLVNQNVLDTVIEFPPKVLSNTNISFALVMISSNFSDSVTMLSADADRYLTSTGSANRSVNPTQIIDDLKGKNHTDSTITVSHQELSDDGFNLSPVRHLAKKNSPLSKITRNHQCIPLNAVADIYRPIPIKASDNGGEKYTEVMLGDFAESGIVTSGSRSRLLDETATQKIQKVVLNKGDIVLGAKGSVGKVGIVGTIAEKCYAGQSMVVIRAKKDGLIKESEYLYQYLALPEVRDYLESMATGAAIQFISAKDLGGLEVPLLTAEDQHKVVEKFQEIQKRYAQIESLRKEAEEIKNKAFDGIEVERGNKG